MAETPDPGAGCHWPRAGGRSHNTVVPTSRGLDRRGGRCGRHRRDHRDRRNRRRRRGPGGGRGADRGAHRGADRGAAAEPTEEPAAEPTEEPAAEPTEEPTAEPTEEPTAEPTAEPTEPPADLVDMPASGVTGVLAAYGSFPDEALPFPDGTVTAHWYQWDGSYVVVYAGWAVDESSQWCPGNSINKGGSFESISNGPVGSEGCEPADAFEDTPTTIVEPPLGPRVCGPLVIYTTAIAVEDSDGAGNLLFGTVERYDGSAFVGSTSQAPVDAAATPELDPGAPGYQVPDGFVPDGATEITCAS